MANALNFIISESKRYAALPYVESGNNHQKFSDVVSRYGLAGCQDQAWCATYQFALELMAYGKADALSHWCMTDKNYCGYSVFSTRDKFAAKNRTGSTPRLGALVIFKRSHMGRVIAINGNTFSCAEGNTSNKEFNRDGNACAVKTYSATDPGIDCFCYIDYGDDKLTRIKIIKAYRAVYEMAHNLGWRYGDSHSVPPCIGDATISCDRLIALAFWILGYQDQPAGGFTVNQSDGRYMEPYLVRYGLKKNTDPAKCKKSDAVIFRNDRLIPNAGWHAFGLTEFTNVNKVSKYDLGSNERIAAQQPYHNVPLNQWEGSRWFYASFQCEEDSTRDYYEFNPSDVKAGTESNSAYEACIILKARGYKGILENGKRKDLELNFRHTIGDMAATAQCQADRVKNGYRVDCKVGEINASFWAVLLGGATPFRLYELPRCQTNGMSVLFWQEQMRARGILDDDGNEIELDRQWGPKTASTVRKYCKAVGLKARDIVDYEVWQSVCGGV